MKIRALVILLLIYGCANGGDEADKLRWLEKADPIKDAKEALSNNDNKLLAVAGYTVIIPGVDESMQMYYLDNYEYTVIDGTTDAVESDEHIRLIKLAYEYAKIFNSVKLDALQN